MRGFGPFSHQLMDPLHIIQSPPRGFPYVVIMASSGYFRKENVNVEKNIVQSSDICSQTSGTQAIHFAMTIIINLTLLLWPHREFECKG